MGFFKKVGKFFKKTSKKSVKLVRNTGRFYRRNIKKSVKIIGKGQKIAAKAAGVPPELTGASLIDRFSKKTNLPPLATSLVSEPLNNPTTLPKNVIEEKTFFGFPKKIVQIFSVAFPVALIALYFIIKKNK